MSTTKVAGALDWGFVDHPGNGRLMEICTKWTLPNFSSYYKCDKASVTSPCLEELEVSSEAVDGHLRMLLFVSPCPGGPNQGKLSVELSFRVAFTETELRIDSQTRDDMKKWPAFGLGKAELKYPLVVDKPSTLEKYIRFSQTEQYERNVPKRLGSTISWSIVVDITESAEKKKDIFTASVVVSLDDCIYSRAFKLPVYEFQLYHDVGERLREFYERGEMSDVTITVGSGNVSKQIKAHRAVLAAASDVFQAMFSHDMKENKSGECKLDEKFDIAKIIVDSFYGIPIAARVAKNAKEIFVAADKYQLASLMKYAAEAMGKSVTVKNAVESFVFAKDKTLPALAEKVISVVEKHYTAFNVAGGFIEIVQKCSPELATEFFAILGKKGKKRSAEDADLKQEDAKRINRDGDVNEEDEINEEDDDDEEENYFSDDE